MQVTCQVNIHKDIKKLLEEILTDFGISKNVSINIQEEPFINLNKSIFEIGLSEEAITNKTILIPQLSSLLLTKYEHNGQMSNKGQIKTPVKYLGIPQESFWDYIKALDRHVLVYRGIMPPWNITTKQFLNLITDLKEGIKEKEFLELGTGTGVQAILASRYGAKVIAVDIAPSAIENAKFNSSIETSEVQQNITFGISDVYSNLNELTRKENHLFDFIFFNNPIMAGSAKTGDLFSETSYAGTDFRVIKEAITGLPKILKASGKAYFLTMELNQKINTIWTNFQLEEFLPSGFKCKQACTPFEFDPNLGFASAIYCVSRK